MDCHKQIVEPATFRRPRASKEKEAHNIEILHNQILNCGARDRGRQELKSFSKCIALELTKAKQCAACRSQLHPVVHLCNDFFTHCCAENTWLLNSFLLGQDQTSLASNQMLMT